MCIHFMKYFHFFSMSVIKDKELDFNIDIFIFNNLFINMYDYVEYNCFKKKVQER